MADVFISYKREDRPKILSMVACLEGAGYSVWYDAALPNGTPFPREIQRELQAAKCVLVVWSQKSVESEWVYVEANYARENDKLAAVEIEVCHPPLIFSIVQSTDLKGWSGNCDDLRWQAVMRRVVELCGEREGKPPPPPEPPRVQPESHADLSIFRDAPEAPEMLVIPGGAFLMGSPKDEEGRFNDEGPQHEVKVPRFALGRYAVTFEEYDAYCDETGTRKPKDEGWGRGRRPVINVSWRDAVAYCAWLSERTEQDYRLPSEAEWEYACRAGTTTPFSGGHTISTDQANYDGNNRYGTGKKGVYRKKTVPVDEFAPNGFGLYQMHGNVWEWCADHWHGNYQGAPTDGSAWLTRWGVLSARVLRGGSWVNVPQYLRSASRGWDAPSNRNNGVGFRVARTL